MGEILQKENQNHKNRVIYSDKEIFDTAMARIVEKFGDYDMVSEEFSFSREFSNYYDGELGGEGLRRIYSFDRLVDASEQAEIKEWTNALELELAVNGDRRINLDPGFINHGRLMLATTKKAGFRIPLKRGIYTELTLYWARGEWHKLPWTYRDYQSEKVQKFITRARAKYLAQRKELIKTANDGAEG